MMWTYWLGTAFMVCLARATDVIVSSSNCGKTVHLGTYGSATLTYMGGRIGTETCKYEFEADDYSKKICVDHMSFDLPCNVKVKYNGGFYADYYPDETFSCYEPQTETWCTSSMSAHIGFETESGIIMGGGKTELRIYTKDTFATDIVESTFRSVIVTIVVVVSVIVVLIIFVIVIVCCVCNKRRSQAGTVYRTPQQAAATTGSYPVVQTTTTPAAYPYQTQPQAGYQPPPPPQGYQQHPPQSYGAGYQPQQPQGYSAGYQPPPPQGYQADYQPPPPQAYGPGYQPPTSQPSGPPTMTEKPVQASAPPASDYPMNSMDQPPPYPGI